MQKHPHAKFILLLAGKPNTWVCQQTRPEVQQDPRVRATALGELSRRHRSQNALTQNALTQNALTQNLEASFSNALTDPSGQVRQRACLEIGRLRIQLAAKVEALLSDPEPSVVEVAAWCLGELTPTVNTESLLSRSAMNHEHALVREAAVAALGSLGLGIEAVIAACDDKPAIRRRAVLCLVNYEDDRIQALVERAKQDRDWQVRSAAELVAEA